MLAWLKKDGQGYQTRANQMLRERMLDATAAMICGDGWPAVTMARVADEVGISRQSVYKEIGGKTGDSDLLPLLAIRPEPVLGRAIAAVRAEARTLYAGLGLPQQTIDQVSEIVVRLTLSHLMQPTGPIDQAVAQIRTLIEAALAP